MTTSAIKPVVEFLELDAVASKREARQELFSEQYDDRTYCYLQGVKEALQRAYGIYIFYDSRGRAIYAGKAVKQTLWAEMNGAYNRNRGDLQTIRLVSHPVEKGTFHRLRENKAHLPAPCSAMADRKLCKRLLDSAERTDLHL